MKVLYIKPDGRVKAVRVMAQYDNEVTQADIKKLMPNRFGVVLAQKISRLAFLYVLFVERDSVTLKLPVNMVATKLTNEDTGLLRGDVILVRTNHFGSGAKYFALEDAEVKTDMDDNSKLYLSNCVFCGNECQGHELGDIGGLENIIVKIEVIINNTNNIRCFFKKVFGF